MPNNQVILVTGGAGYKGSVLIPELINNGYYVKCLDRFFFGKEFLEQEKFAENLELIQDDIRWCDSKYFENVDAVLDLAALSNDPVGDLNPSKTFDINFLGRSRIARLAKLSGVPKYILASSASNYGFQTEIVNEESKVGPLTAYSTANHLAEMDNLSISDKNFCVTVLRFSSIFGLSPRMRFDLAVNNMTLDYFNEGIIRISGDGKQSRPFLHIKDATLAYLKVLKSESDLVNGQIFNVGADSQNFEIEKLAKEVASALSNDAEIQYVGTKDHRSYVASFEKIKNQLGFVPKYSVADGAHEIYDALKNGIISDSKKTKTVEWYQYLLSSKEVSKEYLLRGTIL
jgi:nucleoside-diphosphate-sugar epimerase|tara:strand:+ start:1258 stop:2289 length:1032 start_codon:yes stop_codon:yes gene_type:complete